MKRIPLSQLRGIKLPAAKDDEEDRLVSLRRTLAFHQDSPDSLVLCVADSIAALCPEDKQPAKDATLKS